jgi:alkylhydroperoxidase family enzyme
VSPVRSTGRSPVNPLDDALRDLAQLVTLAPWKLSDAAYEPLRNAGFEDAALFDVCATASTAGVFSRIEVALASLGT